jgi:hypothetical protein
VLANSSFRTFEFESALSEIAGDVSGVWGEEDEDELRDLEDYFPFQDVLESGEK